jgi:hypothetical protein
MEKRGTQPDRVEQLEPKEQRERSGAVPCHGSGAMLPGYQAELLNPET